MADPIEILIHEMLRRGALADDAEGAGGRRMVVDHYRVLLAALPEQGEAMVTFMDGQIKRALTEWHSVGGPSVADIYLLLVGPFGAAGDPGWEAVAAGWEQDELVCRKMVWLPDSTGSDVAGFLDRTFLARPWDKAEKLGTEALATLETSLDLPTGWLPLLLDSGIEGRELIERLLDTIPEVRT